MASDTVTVACKAPNGVLLRLFEMKPHVEPVLGGGTREVVQAVQVGPVIKINGYAAEAGKMPASGAEVLLGYALTPGVPADFFDQWLKQNEQHDLVLNGLIFAHTQTASVKSQIRENEARWDGLQPMSQKADPRMSKRDQTAIAPASE